MVYNLNLTERQQEVAHIIAYYGEPDIFNSLSDDTLRNIIAIMKEIDKEVVTLYQKNYENEHVPH